MLALSVVGGWLAGRADFVPRLWITLPVMLTFAFVSNLSYALVGSLLRAWLAQGRRLLWFNRGMAMVLVLTCVWLLTYTVPMSPSHASSSSSFALLLSSTSKAPV
jgi:threonine/homoserine/homoserine lactone efflux protein